MELRHFVYGVDLGSFRQDRLISSKLSETDSRMFDAIVSDYGSLGTAGLSRRSAGADVILKIKAYDIYMYVRYYPLMDVKTGTGSSREFSYFHAFILNEEELDCLGYAPWVLKQYFIKRFENDKIIGFDDEPWHIVGEAKDKYISITHNGISSAEKKEQKHYFFWQKEQEGKLICTKDPYKLLNLLNYQQRAYLCSMGVLIISSIKKSLPSNFATFIKFLFLEGSAASSSSISGYKEITDQEFLSIIPNRSTENTNDITKSQAQEEILTQYIAREEPVKEKKTDINISIDKRSKPVEEILPINQPDSGLNNLQAIVNSLKNKIKRNKREKKMIITIGLILLLGMPIAYHYIIIPRLYTKEIITSANSVKDDNEIKTKLQKFESENLRLKDTISSLKVEIMQFTPIAEETDDDRNMKKLEAKNSELSEKINKLKDSVKIRDQNIKALKDDLINSETRNRTKDQTITKLGDDLKKSETSNKDKDQTITKLGDDLKKSGIIISNKEQSIQDLTQQLNDSKNKKKN